MSETYQTEPVSSAPAHNPGRKPPVSERRIFEPPPTERLLDSHEAAALLKIHPRTLQRLAQRGQIAGVQVGKLWRFRASSIDAWVQAKLAS